MARKNSKIMLEPAGNGCSIVKVRGVSEFGQKHGVPIGRICAASGGYEYSSVGASRAMHGPKKTKAGAVLAVVKNYKAWIG